MNTLKNKGVIVLAVSAIMTLASCGGGSGSSSSSSASSSATTASSESAPAASSSSAASSSEADEGGEAVSSSEAASSSEVESSSEAESSSSAASSSSAEGDKTYTYNTYTTVSPSNWNELTYQDNNDTQIMSRIGGSFFTYNYVFDEAGNIKPGEFSVDYDAVAHAEDVTEMFEGNAKYSVPEDAGFGYAYEFELRHDLKWDDGTPITAEDFIYTMKEQLNPLFKNYRADSFYNNSLVIHNAYNYVMQGSDTYVASKTLYGGIYDEANDANLVFHGKMPAATDDAYDGATSYIVNYLNESGYGDYITSRGLQWLLGALWSASFSEGAVDALEGKTLAEIKADPILLGYWQEIIGWWQTEPGEELDFFVTKYKFPEVDFADVGLFADESDPYKLTMVMDSSIPLFKEDGETLSYHAAYDFGSLPLVKKDLYEANKVEPQIEGGLWTSKYNSSLDSTASWGPYKLTSFQAGKEYILERNENWYGYNMEEYAGQYQTDRIVCQTIAEYKTAFLAFEAGEIDSIGIDVSVAADYKNSQRAVFTADDFVQSMQLQSNAEALKNREEEGIDKEILTYKDFRKAISVGFNRADYANKCTTASLAGYGLFNSMHYYDVENGGVYRNEDVAKRVLCDVYGVNVDEFDSLDEAYASLNGGNNLTLARALVTSAYEQALADGKISETDKVELVVGTAEDTISTRRVYDYLNAAFKEMCVDTPLEGRIELKFDTSFGTKWANDFRDGAYDICTGGWTGAAWNPGYFLMAYLSKDYMYSQGWDTENEMLTFNPYGDDDPTHEYTMSLMAWWRCLNGKPAESDPYQFYWGDGQVETEFRLRIIAALEKAVLEVYYTVPIANSFSASMISYKVEYISRDYHTFMSYGGLRYMTYNYDDAAWDAVKGSFNYKL